MYPVVDPAGLDARRRAVGLSTVAAHERRLRKLYGAC